MKAKALLDRKGVGYNEYFIDRDERTRTVMVSRTGGRTTVPQIFINGRGIGGFDELDALETAGQFDVLLAQAPARPWDQRGSASGPQGMPRPRTSS